DAHHAGGGRSTALLCRRQSDERRVRNGVDEPQSEERSRTPSGDDRGLRRDDLPDEVACRKYTDSVILNERAAELQQRIELVIRRGSEPCFNSIASSADGRPGVT